MAPTFLQWVAVLHIGQSKTGTLLRLHHTEHWLTTCGLIAALSAILALLACGLGWLSPCGFFSHWATLTIAGIAGGPRLHRTLKPLFWVPSNDPSLNGNRT